ncbi:hypothetical protein BDV93DRAFT_557070 [Ceratobasidium sp. AG-I]|nr:hypothetical protein BDV93DRAFT_557070 [Ceratobasidium sp. AG-I]
MTAGNSTVELGLLALPTELLIHVLLAVEEPWAIHHSAKIFFAISEDEHYLFLRDTSLPPPLIVWNAIKRWGPQLSPEYLQRLLDFGAPVPLAFAQLLTNPRIPRPAPARALHATLMSLPAHTRVLLVSVHIRVPSNLETERFIWDSLIHDDDQRVFESLFGTPNARNITAPAQALFDVRGFVPFCGGKSEAERGVGSLEGAFEVAYKSFVSTPTNSSPLLALLSSTTVCTLIATDEGNLKSRLLVSALAIAGTQCAAFLMQHRAFWRPRLNVIESLLNLGANENDITTFIETTTSPSPAWPPSTSGSPTTPQLAHHFPNSCNAQALPPTYWLPKPEHTTDSIANALLRYTNSRAQSEDGPSWFLKYHASLGRIYAYFAQQPNQLAQSLCNALSNMACAATDELFAPNQSVCKYEGAGAGRMWGDTTTAWTLCEKFGAAPRERVLCAVRKKVEELVRGGPLVRTDPFSFAEWGMHAYLIARLDPHDRRRVLTGFNSSDQGSSDMRPLEESEYARKRLLDTGLPLKFLELAA